MLLLFNPSIFSTQIESGSRSGYWRLFYYNLQAEELKKDEQKQREETPKREIQGSQVQPLEARPKRRRKVEVEEWVPPTLPKPIYRKSPEVTLPLITPFLSIISDEFRSWLITSEPMRIQMLANQAANEEEHDVELLLLVA